MTTSEAAPKKRRRGRAEPYRWRVSDGLWARLESLLQDPPRRFRYPGRSRYPARQCLEGILYVLFTDTPWLEMPYRELGLPSGETCQAPARGVVEQRGLLEQALRRAAGASWRDADKLDWSRVIVDASTGGGQKGGAQVARTLPGPTRGAVITWP